MDKLRFESVNIAAANIDKIAAMFPAAITEALDEEKSTPENKVYKKAVNFDVLRTLLDDEVAGDEAYEFTWVGKREAIREAGRPIRKTLRPCVEESKNWEATENLYIEGDNLDVLKLLQESYLGKVKMIYIDPPYNTGSDFVYRDNFAQSREEYEEAAGICDENDNRMVRNMESNGRFHSDWCSMMYPRMVLARNLLQDDGITFISIDDNELENLKKICNEVFGAGNFVGTITWESKTKCQNTKTAKRQLQRKQEYILVYKKRPGRYEFILESIEAREYPNEDENGKYRIEQIGEMSASGIRGRNSMVFSILGVNPKEGNQWKFGVETIKEYIQRNDLFVENGRAYFKIRENDEEDKMEPFWTLLLKEIGTAETAKAELKSIIGDHGFETVKPVELLKKLVFHVCKTQDLVLDFFSGSATAAHAVMQLNAEDGGKRRFIMVQLPESTDKKTEAYKAGYKNICEIGKERIRRAGEKIKEEAGLMTQDLDIGFRVLKLDDTNMKDVYYAADEYNQDMLAQLESNIKDDRTDMDLLYGCLLDWGLPLAMPHTHEEFDGVTIHNYNNGDLIACFAPKISEKVVKEIAKRLPLRVVFRDSSFSSSPEKINVEEIFKLLAPKTTVKVL